MSGEVQLFRVSWVQIDDKHARITMNDEQIGPVIPMEHANPILQWFIGHLEQRVQGTMDRLGLTDGAIIKAEHTVPEGICPSCGKGAGGPIADIIEDPCPVCRR